MNTSDWYFNQAIKILDVAKNSSGMSKRNRVLTALRYLIAYVVGRRPPDNTATGTADEPKCDRCFTKVPFGRDKEMCNRCERGITVNGNIKKVSSGPDKRLMLTESPEQKERIRKHRKRVKKEIKRLGLERDKANDT